MLAKMLVMRLGQQAVLAKSHWQSAAGASVTTKQQQQL